MNRSVRISAIGLVMLVLTTAVAAQQAATALPEVAAGAYRTLPAVPLFDGPAPTPADWAGRLPGPVKEVARADGEALFNITEPRYLPFLPDRARNTRTAVVVGPGGGFRQLSVNGEGISVAKWLAERGVAAFVLQYRLVQQPGPEFSMGARMQEMSMDVAGAPAVEDTIRTIAMIRARAAEYDIDPSRIVAIGFSAGAHAVAHAGLATDVAARPNFVAPIYGAPFGVIPPIPAADAANRLPPFFLAMAQDDPLVGDAVRAFYAELFAKGYRPETHLYMSGGHGFGMNARRHTSDLFINQFFAWMRAQGLTQKPGDPDQRPAPGRGGGRRGGGPGGGRGTVPTQP